MSRKQGESAKKGMNGVEEKARIKFSKVTEGWEPRTSLGRKVKSGEITDIDTVLNDGYKVLEAEVIDMLLPNLSSELMMIGQAKGKFGGGQRRVFKQTQKKTAEGNKPHFSTAVVVGNQDGYVGIGYGKSKETVPAREKAIRKAKLNIFKIRRGCGSWECGCRTGHSIPYMVTGKVGSVVVRLIPAPKGTGLVAEKEVQKILQAAGIRDIWSKSIGQTRTKFNMIMATDAALRKLTKTKVKPASAERLGLIEGKIVA